MTAFFDIFRQWLFAPRDGWTLGVYIFAAMATGAMVLAALTSLPPRMRRHVVVGVTFVGGLFLALEFLLPGSGNSPNPLTRYTPIVANVHTVIGSFALLIGILNLFQIHGRSVTKRRQGWGNSIAFFAAFFAIILAGFLQNQPGAEPNAAGVTYGILFSGFLKPLQATTFSLIAFYIVSAAYRAFRIRTAESVLLMTTAAIIMLALVPIGASMTSWLPKEGFLSAFRLESMGYWLLIWPNMAVQRALAFGVGIGALATGLRIWLSLERGSFFDRQL